MKAIAALGALIVVFGLALIVVAGARVLVGEIARVREQRRLTRAPWVVGQHTADDGTIMVVVERPGEAPRAVRPIAPDDPDAESELILAQEEAAALARTMNRA